MLSSTVQSYSKLIRLHNLLLGLETGPIFLRGSFLEKADDFSFTRADILDCQSLLLNSKLKVTCAKEGCWKIRRDVLL